MINLTAFHDEMAGLLDEKIAVDTHPDFSKVFDIVSHKILLEKTMEVWAGRGNSGQETVNSWAQGMLEACN